MLIAVAVCGAAYAGYGYIQATTSINYPDRNNGIEIYQDLKNIGCAASKFESGKALPSSTSIPSYNVFLTNARGKTIIIYQDFHLGYDEGINKYYLQETVYVFLFTENVQYSYSRVWHVNGSEADMRRMWTTNTIQFS